MFYFKRNFILDKSILICFQATSGEESSESGPTQAELDLWDDSVLEVSSCIDDKTNDICPTNQLASDIIAI